MEFVPFPKIARLSRECVVTEKLDGTNASIHLDEEGNVRVGSRNRWIEPGDDNFGFARWVHDNLEELRQLGPGSHYGEWWGKGIQRGYGLEEKRFSLFNAGRWTEENKPGICSIVPVLYQGMFDTTAIDNALFDLAENGSRAAPGFMQPEGVIVFHTHSRTLFKKTLDKNDAHKEQN